MQEPVSSSVSPSVSMEHRNTNISESQPIPTQVIPDDTPPLISVVHTPASIGRPRAQVQSIQIQDQGLVTGTCKEIRNF